jgi:N-acetylglucosaminyl-diphospho-decaprenol L-rhamnosyltransferase
VFPSSGLAVNRKYSRAGRCLPLYENFKERRLDENCIARGPGRCGGLEIRAAKAAAMPRVAVVIVTYRCAALTISCLRSLLAERSATTVTLGVVVVDNASGDAAQIAEAIRQEGWESWVKLVETPVNGGFAYGSNFGFAVACQEGAPDYFHMLNPDTLARPGAVSALVDFLERHPNVGIAGSSFENEDGTPRPRAFRFPSLLTEVDGGLRLGIVSRLLKPWSILVPIGAEPREVDWASGASMMIRRQVIEAVGTLDEGFFLYFEETEFCWRACRAGFPMWYVPASRVMHLGGQSTRVTVKKAVAERLPDYWFQSRRRYFLLTRGLLQSAVIDLAALATGALGTAKLIVQGRRDSVVPHYLRDLWRHSVLRARNRLPAMSQRKQPPLAPMMRHVG